MRRYPKMVSNWMLRMSSKRIKLFEVCLVLSMILAVFPTVRGESRTSESSSLDRGLLTSDVIAWGIFKLPVEPKNTKEGHVFLFQVSNSIIPNDYQGEITVESALPTEDPIISRINELESNLTSLRKKLQGGDNSPLRALHQENLRNVEENIKLHTTRIGTVPYIELGVRSLIFLVKEGEYYHFHPEWSVYYGERAESLGKRAIKRLAELSEIEKSKVDAWRATYHRLYEEQKAEEIYWQKTIQDEKKRIRGEREREKRMPE